MASRVKCLAFLVSVWGIVAILAPGNEKVENIISLATIHRAGDFLNQGFSSEAQNMEMVGGTMFLVLQWLYNLSHLDSAQRNCFTIQKGCLRALGLTFLINLT